MSIRAAAAAATAATAVAWRRLGEQRTNETTDRGQEREGASTEGLAIYGGNGEIEIERDRERASRIVSIETAASQVVGDDDVSDGIEDELDVGGVCGARHVTVDLFGRRFVLGFELCLDVSCCLAVVLRTCNTQSNDYGLQWLKRVPSTSQRRQLPVYSAKQIVSGDFLIFSSKRSFLFRKRMMDVSVNHLLLQIESNSFKLSCIRFCRRNSICWFTCLPTDGPQSLFNMPPNISCRLHST